MKPKYNIGDKVKFKSDSDALAGVVASFSYVPEAKSFRYSLSVKAFSPEKNEMVNATKTCMEKELVTVK
jgi:hypothetical protein